MGLDLKKWQKDPDLVLTSLADFGYFTFDTFDDESFDGLAPGLTITPPVAAFYANPEVEVVRSPTLNSSTLWTRNYTKMEADFRATVITNGSQSTGRGLLTTQFIPSIKGHYESITWDFDYPNEVTVQSESPIHKCYTENDKQYSIKLTVSGPSGVVEVVKNNYIEVFGLPS